MRIHNITTDDMLNGDGLRVVLWVAGCSHHCDGCQNPMTWNPEDGVLYTDQTQEELMKTLEPDWIRGITFSGGDPMYTRNILKVNKIIHDIKERYPNKDIWVYTGYTWDEINHLTHFLKNVDVLVDGRFEKELADTSYPWAGSTNQRVIDVQKSLERKEVVLYESH